MNPGRTTNTIWSPFVSSSSDDRTPSYSNHHLYNSYSDASSAVEYTNLGRLHGGSSSAADYSFQPPLPLDSASDINGGGYPQNPNFGTIVAGYPMISDGSSWFSNFPSNPELFENPFHFSGAEGSIIESFAHIPHPCNPSVPFFNAPPINSTVTTTMGPSPPKRRAGGRRPKEEECKLPPEEEEKRRQRRIRNKEAAARCRQRRLDQMNTLEGKVQELQNHQDVLESELNRLMQEKSELEFVLKSHEQICQMRDIKLSNSNRGGRPHRAVMVVAKNEPDVLTDDQSADPTLSSVVVGTKSVDQADNMQMLNRPNTLTLGGPSVETPGISNQTPSRMFNFDGPTGYTPVTSGGGMTPFMNILMTGSQLTLETPTTELPAKMEVSSGGVGNNFTKL